MQYRLIISIIISTIFTNFLYAGTFSSKLTLETYLFLKQYESVKNTKSDKKSMLETYSFQEQDGIDVVKLYIKINNKYSQSEIKKLGCEILVQTKSVILVSVPVSNIEKLTGIAGLDLLEIGLKLTPSLDKALPAANVTEVHKGTSLKQSYYGNGVIVGVVDWGFDFTHPMFSDSLKHSRVKRAWVSDDTTGMPPANSKYGTVYTDSNYIAKTLKFSAIDNSHGSHVLGIAAGSRVNGQNYKFSGVAPSADIAVVELGTQKIEIIEALKYLFSYADSVNKPIVVNMSLGSFAPGQLSRLRDLQLSEYLRQHQQGKVLVVAAGNAGNSKMHFEYSFYKDTIRGVVYVVPYRRNLEYKGRATFSFWGNENDIFDVDLYLGTPYSQKTIELKKASTNDNQSFDTTFTVDWFDPATGDTYTKKYNVIVNAYSNASNAQYISKKPYVECSVIDYNPEVYSTHGKNDAVLFEIRSERANIHGWNHNSLPIFSGTTGNKKFIPDSYYTIGSPAIVAEAVTIGASVSRNMIYPYDSKNIKPYAYGAGQEDDIASFSSVGPVIDSSETKPDIIAPGSSLYSAYNGFDTTYLQNENWLNKITVDFTKDSIHRFVAMSGTSMSTPMVTGIVALMLELNPKLTHSEIKDIMRITAINDDFTGNAKDDKSIVWGWGKIDAHAIMKKLELKDVAEEQNFEFGVYPNPIINNEITVSVENETNLPFVVNVYDQTGKLVYISSLQKTKTLDVSNLGNGTYFLKIDNGKINSVKKITVTK